MDTRVYVFSDRIEVTYALSRMVCFCMEKKDIFTIIEYTDGFNQKQVLVFDFGKRKIEAQQEISSPYP